MEADLRDVGDRMTTWGYHTTSTRGATTLTHTPGWGSCPNRMVTEPGAVPRDRFLAPIGATALLRAAAKTATFPLLKPSMGISRRKSLGLSRGKEMETRNYTTLGCFQYRQRRSHSLTMYPPRLTTALQITSKWLNNRVHKRRCSAILAL